MGLKSQTIMVGAAHPGVRLQGGERGVVLGEPNVVRGIVAGEADGRAVGLEDGGDRRESRYLLGEIAPHGGVTSVLADEHRGEAHGVAVGRWDGRVRGVRDGEGEAIEHLGLSHERVPPIALELISLAARVERLCAVSLRHRTHRGGYIGADHGASARARAARHDAPPVATEDAPPELEVDAALDVETLPALALETPAPPAPAVEELVTEAPTELALEAETVTEFDAEAVLELVLVVTAPVLAAEVVAVPWSPSVPGLVLVPLQAKVSRHSG